jgi:hypothetical protein
MDRRQSVGKAENNEPLRMSPVPTLAWRNRRAGHHESKATGAVRAFGKWGCSPSKKKSIMRAMLRLCQLDPALQGYFHMTVTEHRGLRRPRKRDGRNKEREPYERAQKA